MTTIWRRSGGYGRAIPRQSKMIFAPSSVMMAPWMSGRAQRSTLDRVKDYIRRRGENVSSMEVEAVFISHEDVLEAAAVGVKADEGASAEDEILICLVAREGCTIDAAALLDWCEERMPYFALPRYLRVLDHLPKTPTERVRKVELRDAGITADTFDRAAAEGPRG